MSLTYTVQPIRHFIEKMDYLVINIFLSLKKA